MIDPRLLQLASPSLPVGAYSYSQGLEAAIEAAIVRDAPSAESWIRDVMELSLGSMEAPVFLRLADAWRRGDDDSAVRWNDWFVASRETAELRAETLQMGHSLRRLLTDLALDGGRLARLEEIAFPAAFAFASATWRIAPAQALAAYLFSWLENQVLAAVKSLPLGQTDGQRLLLALGAVLPDVVERASRLGDEDLGNFAPGLALLCSRHETQYTRIFRS